MIHGILERAIPGSVALITAACASGGNPIFLACHHPHDEDLRMSGVEIVQKIVGMHFNTQGLDVELMLVLNFQAYLPFWENRLA